MFREHPDEWEPLWADDQLAERNRVLAGNSSPSPLPECVVCGEPAHFLTDTPHHRLPHCGSAPCARVLVDAEVYENGDVLLPWDFERGSGQACPDEPPEEGEEEEAEEEFEIGGEGMAEPVGKAD